MILKKIQQPIEKYLTSTDKILKHGLGVNKITLINQINEFTPILKGKKIRSTLLFLLAGLSKCLDDDLAHVAASIEMLHLSSLVHDDVVDNSEFRRGERTLNAKFGNLVSVLWGDFIFINSIGIMIDSKKEFLLKILIRIARKMAEGQLLEAENTNNYDIDEATYFSIVENKTAALFGGIAEIVAGLDKSQKQKVEAYKEFGLNFGLMFQVKDDLLDLFSDNSGKDRFRDLKEGKITFPLIKLLKKNDSHVLRDFSEENQDQLLQVLDQYQIKELVYETIDGYYDQCLKFLDSFSDGIYKESLVTLLNFIKHRDY